jgi:hypothetical protein
LEAQTHGADLARRMAQALGAKPRLIHAPGLVKDKIIRDALAMDKRTSPWWALGPWNRAPHSCPAAAHSPATRLQT